MFVSTKWIAVVVSASALVYSVMLRIRLFVAS
jgi:hypothetical protein